MIRALAFLAYFLLSLIPLARTSAQDFQSAELNGITLSYLIVGEGEPLVLLHGFMDTGAIWDPILDDFASQYRLIVPDLRGHGRSTNPDGEFTHRQAALDVFALLDEIGVRDFKAMGISTGGMILLHMATTQVERVEAMVLIGATTYFPEQARVILRSLSPDNMLPALLDSTGRGHSGGTEQTRRLMKQFISFQDSYDDINFTPPLLSTIAARTLIIHGDRDIFFPVSIPTEAHEAIANSYLWIVPNGGHETFFDSEASRGFFAQTVNAFLAGDWE